MFKKILGIFGIKRRHGDLKAEIERVQFDINHLKDIRTRILPKFEDSLEVLHFYEAALGLLNSDDFHPAAKLIVASKKEEFDNLAQKYIDVLSSAESGDSESYKTLSELDEKIDSIISSTKKKFSSGIEGQKYGLAQLEKHKFGKGLQWTNQLETAKKDFALVQNRADLIKDLLKNNPSRALMEQCMSEKLLTLQKDVIDVCARYLLVDNPNDKLIKEYFSTLNMLSMGMNIEQTTGFGNISTEETLHLIESKMKGEIDAQVQKLRAKISPAFKKIDLDKSLDQSLEM